MSEQRKQYLICCTNTSLQQWLVGNALGRPFTSEARAQKMMRVLNRKYPGVDTYVTSITPFPEKEPE